MLSPKPTPQRVDQRVTHLPSSPPVYRINHDALRKLGLGLGEDDDTCSIASQLSDQMDDEVRSEDIDGPTDFTANLTYWMRHADLKSPEDEAHEIKAEESVEGEEMGEQEHDLHLEGSMLSKADAEGTKIPDNERSHTVQQDRTSNMESFGEPHDDLSDIQFPSSLSIGEDIDERVSDDTMEKEKETIMEPSSTAGDLSSRAPRQGASQDEDGLNKDTSGSSASRAPHNAMRTATNTKAVEILSFAKITILCDSPPLSIADQLLRQSHILTICDEAPEQTTPTDQPSSNPAFQEATPGLPASHDPVEFQDLHNHLDVVQDRQDVAFSQLSTRIQQLEISVQGSTRASLERQRDSTIENLSAELSRLGLEKQLLEDRLMDAEATTEECEALLATKERDVERLEAEVERLERERASSGGVVESKGLDLEKATSTPAVREEDIASRKALEAAVAALQYASSVREAETQSLRSELEALLRRNKILEDDRELMSKALMKEWGRQEFGESKPQLYRYKYAGKEDV